MAHIDKRAYAEMFGPTVGDRVRLADTALIVEVEKDFTLQAGGYGEATHMTTTTNTRPLPNVTPTSSTKTTKILTNPPTPNNQPTFGYNTQKTPNDSSP